MKHDECRNTDRFPTVGQNLAIIRDSSTMNVTKELQSMIQKWFDEHKDASPADIDDFQSSNRKIGHFTQLIRDKVAYIGCGVATYDKKGFKGTHLLLACDYSYTNMIGEAVYKSGTACSECEKCHSVYLGLCSANES